MNETLAWESASLDSDAAAVSLVRTVLWDRCHSDSEASRILRTAATLDVDPLEYCAHRLWVGEAAVYRRAAGWAGLRFLEEVPQAIEEAEPRRRPEQIGTARLLRAKFHGRETLFSAPSFSTFLFLHESAALRPGIRELTIIVPPSRLRARLALQMQAKLMDAASNWLTRRWPSASAASDPRVSVRAAFVFVLLLGILVAALAPPALMPITVPVLLVMITLPALLRTAAVVLPRKAQSAFPALSEKDLPVYSVLIPLRDEAKMVPQLVRAMNAIDYPPEKLDIKFVVESRSLETVAALERFMNNPRFSLVVVPDAEPRTKPKAMNFALPLVRGEFVAVFDAEDIPDKDQLRLAAAQFEEQSGLDCLQAELVIENASEKPLTALFAGEYAGQFGLLLPFFARLGLPLPLGGTSNHFRVSALREAGGWDAFNVTEDADLGIRLSRLRYRSGTLASKTLEEAPVTVDQWLRQRTRWMKGWCQTLIVHNRDPLDLLRSIGLKSFLFTEIYLLSMVASPLLHLAFLAVIAQRLLRGEGLNLGTDIMTMMAMGSMVVGYGGAVLLSIAGMLRLKAPPLMIAAQLLLPLYWMLHAIAGLRALHELLSRPHFWSKTEHGRTRLLRFGTQGRRAP